MLFNYTSTIDLLLSICRVKDIAHTLASSSTSDLFAYCMLNFGVIIPSSVFSFSGED